MAKLEREYYDRSCSDEHDAGQEISESLCPVCEGSGCDVDNMGNKTGLPCNNCGGVGKLTHGPF